jgi:LCP family protein required for cell wall assembly
MRTTLKRGIGRGAVVNGNGRAVLPPSPLTEVTRYRQPERERRSTWRRVGRFFFILGAIIVMIGGGLAGGAYLYYHQTIGEISAHSKDVKLASKRLDIPLPNQPAIALVLGYDHRLGKESSNNSRSDTMMLLRADPISHSISMLSFPRDLRTQIWCGDKIIDTNRINAAYSECNAKGSLETVKKLTGLPINFLITVNFIGFRQIVDRIGGVWVDVDRRYFNHNNGSYSSNYANIDLQPGYQLLSGQAALDYVRFRHTDSDLYRIARQQQFVKGIKQQLTHGFSVFTALKVLGAITHNIEIGQAGGGDLSTAVKSYLLFAYNLPSGHFFQAKIQGVTGTNELSAPTAAIQAAVQEFQNPDVQSPQKATAAALGSKAAHFNGPPPSGVTISVLNGNGVQGSASNAAYELSKRGYRIILPATGQMRNAPSFTYFRTKVYFDPAQQGSQIAARRVGNLFGDADVVQLTPDVSRLGNGAMLTVVVGQTFHGTVAPAPVDTTPKKEPAYVRTDPAQTQSLIKSVRRRFDFPLEVPTVLERTSNLDREVPLRVYAMKQGARALRLTFLAGTELAGYWSVTETKWTGAPVLQEPNSKHVLKGREFDFYYSGPHLHMIVLRESGATYWVVNTLLDSLSNETMIAIARGLKPLR